MRLDIENCTYMSKKTEERIKRRKIAYVYLMQRMFGGSPDKMMTILTPKDFTKKNLQDWDEELHAQVFEIIQVENTIGAGEGDAGSVPTIKSIKEKVLKRTNMLIATTDDPARLAQVYKTLSEFEATDDKRERGVVDAVRESVKPLAAKDRETPVTMLDVLRAEGKAPMPVPGKRRPGRPKKNVSQIVNLTEE